MNPRVRSKALELLQAGKAITKHDLAKAAPCHVGSALQALRKMHAEIENVRIASWCISHNQPLPVYKLGLGEDAPRPGPKGRQR